MKWKAVIPIAAVVGAALAITFWYTTTPLATKAPTLVQAKRGEIIVGLTEPGELRALESVTISAPRDLPIIYLIPEGTSVKPGDVLVRFDDAKPAAALSENRARLEIAQADTRKAERELEAQRERLLAELSRFENEVQVAELELAELKRKPLPGDLEKARVELQRAEVTAGIERDRSERLPDLVKRGYLPRNALDDARMKFLEAQVNFQAAQLNFDRVAAGATAAELAKSELRLAIARREVETGQRRLKAQLDSLAAGVKREKANVDRALGEIERSEATLARTILRAPRRGIVVYAKLGEDRPSEKVQLGLIPWEGQPILYLPDVSTMVVDVAINEADIGKVKPGAPVKVRLDTEPGVVFHGHVSQVGTLARGKHRRTDPRSMVRVFDVTISLERNDPRLRPGLSATVDVILDRQVGVVYVPVAAVSHDRGRSTVHVWDHGVVDRREVLIGASNSEHVVIREGVEEGEWVVLAPTAASRD